MPVQNEENRKAKQTEAISEEEKLKQSVQTPERPPDKLLPFLNVKAEIHQNKITNLESKIATRQNKIRNNEVRIEKLNAKADRLEDRNIILKKTLGGLPGVDKLIASNEEKINAIRNDKIPARKEKCNIHSQKIAQLVSRRKSHSIS